MSSILFKWTRYKCARRQTAAFSCAQSHTKHARLNWRIQVMEHPFQILALSFVKRTVNQYVRNCLWDITLQAGRGGGAATCEHVFECMQPLGEADEALSRGAGEDLMKVGMASMGQATVNGGSNYRDAPIAMFSRCVPRRENIDSHPTEQGGC